MQIGFALVKPAGKTIDSSRSVLKYNLNQSGTMAESDAFSSSPSQMN